MSFLFKVWRSIRLIVDPGLNYFGMKRDKVLDYFKDYAWAESPFVLSEVKRNIVKSNDHNSFVIFLNRFPHKLKDWKCCFYQLTYCYIEDFNS